MVSIINLNRRVFIANENVIKENCCLLLAASNVNASDEKYIGCNNCTQGDMFLKAFNESSQLTSPMQTIHVADFMSAKTRTYQITLVDRNGEPFFQIKETITPQWIVSTVNDTNVLIKQLDIDVPAESGIKSVEDILNSSNPDLFDNWLHDSNHFQYYFMQIVSQVGGMFISFLSGLQFTVTFSDGSTGTFKTTDVQNGGRFTKMSYVKGTARDADGQTIPESADEYSNKIFNFTQELTVTNFVSRAGGFGVDIKFLTPGLGGGGRFTCKKVGDKEVCELTKPFPT